MADAGPSTSAPAAGDPSDTQDAPEQSNDVEDKTTDQEDAPAEPFNMDIDEALKVFFSDMKDVDRDNEVNRILWAFKLNPFERLNLRFDATIEDVKRQYRKLSLMVHPDKCKHPQASAAFDILGEAQKQLNNEERRAHLIGILDIAREDVRKERKKQTKHDSLVRVASMLNEAGREGVEAAWEQSDEFHDKWKMKAREYLAQTEWRKRKITKRLKDETSRVEAQEKEDKEKRQKLREDHKNWEANREARVNTWRDFASKKGGGDSGKPKKALGELKPPKLKTNDEDKLYVQRPVGEQWRPPVDDKPKPKPGSSTSSTGDSRAGFMQFGI
eukprot:CAMPEP_0202899082 /NCGR_PEP_ID=MMETSP1392-20130828/7414_1 /ASSEMBLY_ACC=CAM_ASM_000868 /TAXON_ID=225041 /ORGANISM="Chlamydomonas chlamydogama, Strain SAG 11-48b" /LENGTH=328 /DNA_ID=CAMNT_0049585175 /DNA_START=45 /DNA_END=1032 /DNA_ORIENTATION=+